MTTTTCPEGTPLSRHQARAVSGVRLGRGYFEFANKLVRYSNLASALREVHNIGAETLRYR